MQLLGTPSLSLGEVALKSQAVFAAGNEEGAALIKSQGMKQAGETLKKRRQWLFGGEASEQNCVYRMRGWVCRCSEHRLIPWCPGADTIPAALLCWVLCDCSGKRDTARVRLVKVLLCWNSVFLILLLRTHFPVNFIYFITSSIINILNPVLEKTNKKELNPSSLKWTNTGKKTKQKSPGKILPLKVSTRIYLSFMLKTAWGASPFVEQSPVPTARHHPCVGTQREVPQARSWPPAAQCGMDLLSSRRTESQPQLHPLL